MQIDQKEISVAKQKSTLALKAANDISAIQDEVQLTSASKILSRIKATQKLVKEKKEGITKPLNKALENVRELFRPIETSCKEAEGIVKGKMVEYSDKVKEENRIATEKLAKRVEKGTMKVETAANKITELETAPEQVHNEIGAAQFRIEREVVVEDESKIPTQYWVLDMVKVRKDVLGNASKGIAPLKIPGVKVIEKTSVSGFTAQTKDQIIG